MSQFNKLRPLVQLVPAVAVAAVVMMTLPNTAPVLAEVPERLSATIASSSEVAESEAASESEESEILPALPYADGVYVGSSRGYGGKVKVQVTMEGGFITDLQILDASHETSAFLKRARRLLTIVQDAQTWEVDAISEATYTSRGILGAIQNALTGEEVINPLPPKQEVPEEPPVVEEFVAPSAYRDGVYTASADGYGGSITVQVTISNDTITDITILSADGETRSYFTRARYVISSMLTANSPEVDTVSGATYSSTGIINAVKSAMMKAANDSDSNHEEAPTEEAVSETTAETPVEESADSEAPEVMIPVVEVVKPEKKDPTLLERAKELWDSLFPSEQPASSPSQVVFEAASSSAVTEETASSEVPADQPTPNETQPAETPASSAGSTEAAPDPVSMPEAASETPAEPQPSESEQTELPEETVQ